MPRVPIQNAAGAQRTKAVLLGLGTVLLGKSCPVRARALCHVCYILHPTPSATCHVSHMLQHMPLLICPHLNSCPPSLQPLGTVGMTTVYIPHYYDGFEPAKQRRDEFNKTGNVLSPLDKAAPGTGTRRPGSVYENMNKNAKK